MDGSSGQFGKVELLHFLCTKCTISLFQVPGTDFPPKSDKSTVPSKSVNWLSRNAIFCIVSQKRMRFQLMKRLLRAANAVDMLIIRNGEFDSNLKYSSSIDAPILQGSSSA